MFRIEKVLQVDWPFHIFNFVLVKEWLLDFWSMKKDDK